MKKLQRLYMFLLILIFLLPLAFAQEEQSANSSLMGLGVFFLVFFILLLITLAIIFYIIMNIWMLVDNVQRNLDTKLKWLLVNVLLPFGWVLYYFIIKRRNVLSKKPKKKNEPLALISFLCGCLSFVFGFLGIPAIFLGILSLRNIKKRSSSGGKELAKAGIIVGIIGMILFFTLASLYVWFIAFYVPEQIEKMNLETRTFEGGNLTARMEIFGRTDKNNEVCIEEDTRRFTNGDILCVQFLDVQRFTEGDDGLHWVDYDTVLRDQNGTIYSYAPEILGDDGHYYFENGTYNHLYGGPDEYIYRPLTDLKRGNYTYEVLIYDKIGDKGLYRNWTFTIK